MDTYARNPSVTWMLRIELSTIKIATAYRMDAPTPNSVLAELVMPHPNTFT